MVIHQAIFAVDGADGYDRQPDPELAELSVPEVRRLLEIALPLPPSIDRVQCWMRQPLAPVEFLRALRSYEYQSCEHTGWSGSPAERWHRAAEISAIGALPGYAEAGTWAITPGWARKALQRHSA